MKWFLPSVLVALFCARIIFAEPAEPIRSRIKRESVISSNVASIGYSSKLRALEIEFRRGAIYRFLNVPPRIHRELMAARSKGHYFAVNVRGQYPFIRVRNNYPLLQQPPPRLTNRE